MSVEVLVNSESIIQLDDNHLTNNNSNSQTNKKVFQHSHGNLTGLTFKDYIVLPARARLQVIYKGDFGAEAFIGFKRL